MAALPAELIDLVVENINADDGMHDLKSCCLVASLFQYPSQKRIHRSLTLAFDRGSLHSEDFVASPHYLWRNILSRLENHPHLAEHVVQLHLFLPSSRPLEESADSLLAMGFVLNKLHNVRELKITGLSIGGSPHVWSRLPPKFTEALFAWLRARAAADGRLGHISCSFVNELTPVAIQHMLAASSSLEFTYCRVPGEDSEGASGLPMLLPPTSGRAWGRLGFYQSQPVVLFLLRPDYQGNLVKGLKKLTLSSSDLPGPSSQLCCAVVHGIEDFTLYMSGSARTDRELGLPQQFPRLRRLELMGSNTFAYNKDIFPQILPVYFAPKSTPALSHVVVNMSIWVRNVQSTLASLSFENGVDDYCATHPTVKKLSLVLKFSLVGKGPRLRVENLNHTLLAESLRAALPKMAAKGQLEVLFK
uniref:F-box domain-containing protein n=1 Tax=Mycena chlorophos TaxID=658473 RepID=A0ABQ0LN68_MYCCL|nr:predicted protein [Mycena chlorophos]